MLISASAASAAWGPTPQFAPTAATPRFCSQLRRLLGGNTGERLRVLVERELGDDRQRRDVLHRPDRRLELLEVEKRLDHEEVDSAAVEERGLFVEDVVRIDVIVVALEIPERADRPRDEDRRPGYLAGFPGKLHAGLDDLLESVVEEVGRELAAVGAERVGLDHLRASADEAHVGSSPRLPALEVRLLRAQARPQQ